MKPLVTGIGLQFTESQERSLHWVLTVKRYGRFAAETKEQFAWINALAQPVEALAEARKPRLEVAR